MEAAGVWRLPKELGTDVGRSLGRPPRCLAIHIQYCIYIYNKYDSPPNHSLASYVTSFVLSSSVLQWEQKDKGTVSQDILLYILLIFTITSECHQALKKDKGTVSRDFWHPFYLWPDVRMSSSHLHGRGQILKKDTVRRQCHEIFPSSTVHFDHDVTMFSYHHFDKDKQERR